MKANFLTKLLGSVIFIFGVIGAYLLYAEIIGVQKFLAQNTEALAGKSFNFAILFYLLIVIACSLFLLFVFILLIKNKEIIREKIVELTVERKPDENFNEQTINENNEEIIQEALAINKKIIRNSNPKLFYESVLQELAHRFDLVQGMLFTIDSDKETFKLKATYAYYSDREITDFKIGEGLSGQVIKDRTPLIITNIPDNYITILSGLGKSTPKILYLIPVIQDEIPIGLIELAGFNPLSDREVKVLYQAIFGLSSELGSTKEFSL